MPVRFDKDDGSLICGYGAYKSVLEIDHKGRVSVWSEGEGTVFLLNEAIDAERYLIALIAYASDILAQLKMVKL